MANGRKSDLTRFAMVVGASVGITTIVGFACNSIAWMTDIQSKAKATKVHEVINSKIQEGDIAVEAKAAARLKAHEDRVVGQFNDLKDSAKETNADIKKLLWFEAQRKRGAR